MMSIAAAAYGYKSILEGGGVSPDYTLAVLGWIVVITTGIISLALAGWVLVRLYLAERVVMSRCKCVPVYKHNQTCQYKRAVELWCESLFTGG